MTAEANRAKCPQFAALMVDVRKVWPEARARYVEEGEHTLGAIPAPDHNFWGEIDGAGYVYAIEQAERLNTKGKRK